MVYFKGTLFARLATDSSGKFSIEFSRN